MGKRLAGFFSEGVGSAKKVADDGFAPEIRPIAKPRSWQIHQSETREI
jgi:hypothetical protein